MKYTKIVIVALCKLIFFCYFFYIKNFFLLSIPLIFQPNIYYKGKKMNKTKNASWGTGGRNSGAVIYLTWLRSHQPWRAGIVEGFLPSGSSFRIHGWSSLAFPESLCQNFCLRTSGRSILVWQVLIQLDSRWPWTSQSPLSLSGYSLLEEKIFKVCPRKQNKQEEYGHRAGKCTFSK